jgi:Uma2 family endonuclease
MIMSPAPNLEHQAIVLNLASLLLQIKPGGKVHVAPVDVWLDDANVVQPDVMWISPNSACVPFEKKYYQGAPDLLAEVLSPGTARTDKSAKFKLYEKHGVREYWMVDPEAQYVEVWRREENRFALVGVFGPGETFGSAVLGDKTVEVTRLFQSE